MQLTTQDIKFLRQATSVSFHWGDKYNGGYSNIWAKQERGNVKAELQIDVISNFNNYSGHYAETRGYTPIKAFEMIQNADVVPEWQTITTILRKGDELELLWRVNNNSNTLIEAGFCEDELLLIVNRGTKQLTFKIESRATKINSMARMVTGYYK